MRHTTFRFALDPTPVQQQILARYAGASRFAYKQCLRLVTDAIVARRANPQVRVPWSGFDLINALNAWKCSEAAGRVFVVAPDGAITKRVTGLWWRREVCAQVFEEAAVDLGYALAAYSQAKNGSRKGRVGFPRRKRKGRCRDSFRLRNKKTASNRCLIQVGEGHSRSVTLPVIGQICVHDDTRRLRRLLRPVDHTDPNSGQSVVAPRAKVVCATVSRHGDRWYVSLNVHAPDLHQRRRHPPRPAGDGGGFVGVDRGLVAFAVAATVDGVEVARWEAPKPLARRLGRLRRRSRALSRARPGSRNRAKAARRLSREHARIANIRRSFLQEVSSQLAKTHDKLVIEDLAVANLARNRHLARAIGDAGWAELSRQLVYKQAWRDGQVVVCDRWFPSTKTCSQCGLVKRHMRLVERIFRCDVCGLVMDRDRNAAINLAAWADAAGMVAAQVPDRQASGRVNNALGGEGAGHRQGDGGTSPDEGGTNAPVRAGAEDTREGWRPSDSPRSVDAL
jgi:putative transposase